MTLRKGDVIKMRYAHLIHIRRFFTVAVILSSLVSCTSKPEDSIVGKWRDRSDIQTLELFKDGTITMTINGIHMDGTYTFVARNRIKVDLILCDMEPMTGPSVYIVAIAGDEMTWTMPNGMYLKYRKEK